MQLREVLEKRRSVRRYTDEKVPVETLRELIRLAKTGPSAGAVRGFEVFATDKPLVSRIKAPTYLVICARPGMYFERYGKRGRDLYSLQDATIVGSYLQLVAVDMGLATCWIGAFVEKNVKSAMHLPDEWLPVAILALGYEGE